MKLYPLGHFIEKCADCEKIMGQCRCLAKDKQIRYSICKECEKSYKQERG
ncbi:hypothetical protein LCGC14_0987080 [marine sediment metagenome]|uniref:Uncharacterized protein n=1 Tax=marine sediment metagenome TaxID=412755 RepID=A0A0F9NTI1_9ZZZZ